ncbi:YggS family pyridoxal phosphate-dependent enzyme [Comamonas endophytica]|uniref:Pyridoxal phosphate homeostasis protein n=1 Tax=Comamonas endophytica TaxID=2949090 RepID=A0ABY6G7M4_9BURK|nr:MULTISPECIES: YggS family pyridoxal phosphate-dependent enzyme [unclassified Acidovorax]MCD2510971.1 YggS family pyridoxal phosphate-dependent enzyme [Acidovorax sp. D4N7]UYG50380.1 YggS family pyridoxal phosphate-dependent enzyme [Acidovorax sp. 5MLIR]
MTTIAINLHQIRTRLQQACVDAGRAPDSVALLAVSKTFGPDAVREAALQGQRDFGENYIQEAVEKIAILREMDWEQPALAWHCIGPIQSNKTRLVAEHFDWAHSVDRLKIAQRLSDQRPDGMAPLQVCLQVNPDGGTTKSGVPLEEALALARAVALLPKLQLRGLMAIPDEAGDFAAQCAVHRRVRQLFDSIAASGAPGLAAFDTLSLGMTGDLEAAVQAGSTMVRVGRGIFGGRARAA